MTVDLVARIQAGDVDAFETLYRQHSAKIYTLASRMAGSAEDGEDLLQEIFLQAYRKVGSFKGDSLTLIGPVELKTLDQGSARQLKRDIKSIVTGPRATLVVYEKQTLSARSVGFPPNSREGGLAEKLGYGGRIESLQMTCN